MSRKEKEKQTLVLSLQELYALIPETKSLGRQEYTTTADLLKAIIDTIEESGRWEFVQYIKDKPSMFIVRDTAVTLRFNKNEVETKKQQESSLSRSSVREQMKKEMDTALVKTVTEMAEIHIPVIGKLPWET